MKHDSWKKNATLHPNEMQSSRTTHVLSNSVLKCSNQWIYVIMNHLESFSDQKIAEEHDCYCTYRIRRNIFNESLTSHSKDSWRCIIIASLRWAIWPSCYLPSKKNSHCDTYCEINFLLMTTINLDDSENVFSNNDIRIARVISWDLIYWADMELSTYCLF